ncbi:MAG: PH domain-containing protein [Synergistaceae bacterium]|jgi:uncharacterized membrane protein YdbT with pleckstrin-like domain|nr:PH domain-containing protein [Synergistaceae bacterium]
MSEQIFKPAWKAFYKHFLTMALCFIVVVSASVKWTWGKGWWLFGLLCILCAAGDMLARRSRLTFIVKPDEIALEQGIIGRHSIEISTRSIRTIQVRQNLMQRILNVGDILVASSGTEEYEIRAVNLPNPHAIRDKIQAYGRAPGRDADNAYEKQDYERAPDRDAYKKQDN